VLFEDVRYSVPRHVAFEPVTVKAYIDQIVLVHKGQMVARHRRNRTAGEQVLEPMHFLAVIERKPAYLDHTRLFKELKLPAAFGQLRQRLEKELGPRTGTHHYIRVLQLLGRHSADKVAAAIDAVLHRQCPRFEFIEQKLAAASAMIGAAGASPAHDAPMSATFHLSEGTPIRIPRVIVPTPDLRRFDQLLIHRRGADQCADSNFNGEDHVYYRQARCGRDVIEAQPQDAASADDPGGVCPTLA
jgi:hypothetical protein